MSLAVRSKMVNIVIDGVFFQFNRTGIARVWLALLQEWSNSDNSLRITVLDRGGTFPRIQGISYLNVREYDYDQTGLDCQKLQSICDSLKADIFMSTYYTTPLTTPSILIVHDMIPEVMGAEKVPMWREKHLSILHAGHYIAVSHNTANDLKRFYPGIPEKEIIVIYNGLSPDFIPASPDESVRFKTKYNLNKPYVIFIGSRMSLCGYKNAKLLFLAINCLGKNQQISILCVGGEKTLEPELSELAGNTNILILSLDDEELRVAYSSALALVYPSLYEGFGLPILEAMACGCPIITCANSAIPEVAGEAVIYVDEYDPQPLIEALIQVQDVTVRQALIAQGFERVKHFSWTQMANELASSLEKWAQDYRNRPPSKMSLLWQDFREAQAQLQNHSTQVQTVLPQEEHWQEVPTLSTAVFKQISMQLAEKQQELMQAQQELSHLQSSKVWQLRTAWFNLKKIFIPLIGFIIGLNLLLFINIYDLIATAIKAFEYLKIGFLPKVGLNLVAVSLILGMFGNLGFLSSRFLRFSRIILLGAGLLSLLIFYMV